MMRGKVGRKWRGREEECEEEWESIQGLLGEGDKYMDVRGAFK